MNCESQDEIDDYWAKLSDGGETGQCGWLKDRFGVSWQIVPADLEGLLAEDQKKADRVMAALLQMNKLDIAALQKAYEG